jgi:hypothetical protein
MKHRIGFVTGWPEMQGEWDGEFWHDVEALAISHFRPESSPHHPVVHVKLAHDNAHLFGIFDVKDRFVRCVHTGFQDEVWKDSCVEIFLRPPGGTYFNFEFNCGGAMRASFRSVAGLSPVINLTEDQVSRIRVFHSLPLRIEPELTQEVAWKLEFAIPIEVMEECLKEALPLSGASWRGNLYKCADESSHPHWLAWSPVPEVNFHLPEFFGEFEFS